MSDLRVTNLKGRNPGEAPTLPDGVVIAGITTVSSVIVGTGITLSSSGINVSGIITASSFFGSGANLTGVSGVSTTGSVNTSGIITATSIVVSAGTTALPSISPTGDSNTGIFFPAADTIAFSEGGAEAMRVDSSGRLLVGTSSGNANGGILQLSGGITFPATAVAASDANTLDDYEEGTWTPSYKADTTDPTVTYENINGGKYTKIGRIVHIQATIQSTVISSAGSGNLFIGGLPFTPQTASVGGYSSIYSSLNTVINLAANERVAVFLDGGDAKFRIIAQNDDTASYTTLTGAALASNVSARYLFFSGSYLVA